MSNLGMEHALNALNLQLLRAKVGDRYVMEMLTENKGMLGGEGSGHIICLDKTRPATASLPRCKCWQKCSAPAKACAI